MARPIRRAWLQQLSLPAAAREQLLTELAGLTLGEDLDRWEQELGRTLGNGFFGIFCRRGTQPVAQPRQSYANWCHRVSKVVQYPPGKLRKSRLEGLVNQLSARFGHSRDHTVELTGENANLIIAL